MTEVLLFHHAQGRTRGVLAFAETLRAAGHTVHTPDLFDGRTFADLDEGLAHLEEVGLDDLLERGNQAVKDLPDDLVYVGFSLGVIPAQQLAQTRGGARGAVLMHSCVPVDEFGTDWPAGVPVQIHAKGDDPFFVGDGDRDAALALVEASPDAELFTYPGSQHLFVDATLPSYDEASAALLTERVLGFLERL